MSSYDLLVYLEFMDDEGAFKTAMRGGEYTENEITWRHVANELARLRATMHAVHGGQRYEPPILKTKAQLRAEAQVAEAARERREEFYEFATFDDDSIMDDIEGPLLPREPLGV